MLLWYQHTESRQLASRHVGHTPAPIPASTRPSPADQQYVPLGFAFPLVLPQTCFVVIVGFDAGQLVLAAIRRLVLLLNDVAHFRRPLLLDGPVGMESGVGWL